jgi:ribonuclease Z
MIDCYEIPVSQINNIKNGADWKTEDGVVVPNSMLTVPALPARSYAYCSDTRYIPTLHKIIEGATLLYHESTYLSDYESHAKKYYHSTAAQAATVANDAKVGKLILGHFSARYEDENGILNEAKSIFPNSVLANEGLIFNV